MFQYNRIKSFFKFKAMATLFAAMALSGVANASVYNLPANGDNVVGENKVATVKVGDSLSAFAQRNDVGYYELLEANPRLDPMRIASGSRLLIPHQFVLPHAVREGIIVNLAELRLYYYPPDSGKVIIYPIGIGRIGWQTPVGQLTIIQKKENPDWRVPPAVAEDMAKRGVILPAVIPAGPDNPLGNYMMRLSNYTYLIHGTNHPPGVGRRTSAGCIRMYPEDVEQLFAMVPLGTKVTIVNQPFKAGWLNGQLYLEAHTPLREQRAEYAGRYNSLWQEAITVATRYQAANVDWSLVQKVSKKQMGIPQAIGLASSSPAAVNQNSTAANTAPVVVGQNRVAANTMPAVVGSNTVAANTTPVIVNQNAVANSAPAIRPMAANNGYASVAANTIG
jgi:L,D-transpeptidase ErfK/SrfK